MPKQNKMDTITDKVNIRMNRILDKVHQRLGNTNPYRQVKKSRKEMILDYDDMMSREEQLREQFGDSVVDSYKTNMSKFVGGK